MTMFVYVTCGGKWGFPRDIPGDFPWVSPLLRNIAAISGKCIQACKVVITMSCVA